MLVASAFLLMALGVAPDSSTVPTYGPPVPAPPGKATKQSTEPCQPQDSRDIVVCAQRKQGVRIDTDVVTAERQSEQNARSATATMPAAQKSCSQSPQGCGSGLDGLDLMNVAVVVATTAVKAAKGEDWTKALKPGGPDEYQLYLQAKQEREAREQEAKDAAAIKSIQSRHP